MSRLVRADPVMRNLSDGSLLAGLGTGDAAAAAAFLQRFGRRVFGLTFSILRDRGAAEDAAQETFVRAWRHASAYDPRRGDVAGWLLTIARNVAINMLPTRRVDPVDPDLLTRDVPDREEAGSEERVTNAEVLRQAFARLPEDQRRALILASYFGFTAKEIGELDEVPLGTVKTRIRAGMMKLRADLGVADER